MSEDEAEQWIIERFGSDGHARLSLLVKIVRDEAVHQNLVAPSTLPAMWSRHIVDSAQLLRFVDAVDGGPWLDIGSGAGFPGLVVALLTERSVLLVEPRRRRADFLAGAVKTLALSDRVEVVQAQVERTSRPAQIISARAVASLANLFELASHCATTETQWLLPKGRSAREEVASAQLAWHGVFHVEQSLTDPQSLIVLASGVSRR